MHIVQYALHRNRLDVDNEGHTSLLQKVLRDPCDRAPDQNDGRLESENLENDAVKVLFLLKEHSIERGVPTSQAKQNKSIQVDSGSVGVETVPQLLHNVTSNLARISVLFCSIREVKSGQVNQHLTVSLNTTKEGRKSGDDWAAGSTAQVGSEQRRKALYL